MDPDDLYGLPLERFVPERGALAKALRAEKKREEAAEVAKLRKPTVAAWAVNQLVRTQGAAVKELFQAGDAVRETQSDAIAGRADAAALHQAGERQRAALNGLLDVSRGLLSSEGHELSAAVLERVSETLRAAALDEDARAKVRDGRLDRELRHSGLGLGEAPLAARPPKRQARKQDSAKAKAEAEAAARAERERAAVRKAAEAAEAKARRRAESAARALAKAEGALAAARDEAAAAAEAHARARAELEQG